MDEIDKDGLMKVEVMGAIHRRPAYRQDVAFATPNGPVLCTSYRPDLRAGEVLLEFIGRPPVIVQTGL